MGPSPRPHPNPLPAGEGTVAAALTLTSPGGRGDGCGILNGWRERGRMGRHSCEDFSRSLNFARTLATFGSATART